MNNKLTKNTQKTIQNSYKKLLKNIQNCIKQTGENIANLAVRKKLEMCWQIGKLIEEDLLANDQVGYGGRIFSNLEQDLGIKERALYKMHNFYQAYKQLPPDETGLNWSHYRTLADIKDAEQRENLTNLAIENSWSTRELELEAKKIKSEAVGVGQKNEEENLEKEAQDDQENIGDDAKKTAGDGLEKETNKPKLPKLGKLFCYQLIELPGSKKIYVDCGFHIFKEAATNIEVGAMVEASKDGEKYLFKKSTFSPKKLYTYKAYLERVVDGDTIHAIIDLGFKTYHRQILRLQGVYAAELQTAEGEVASQKLSATLKDVPFLIIRTSQIDIYGRYVADVFLGEDGLEIGEDGSFGGKYLNGMIG